MVAKKTIGYRVKSSSPRAYVQVAWTDEDRTFISNAWSDTIKGPLLTRAQAYRVAAHWLECGYLAKLVRVTLSVSSSCEYCDGPYGCQCHTR
jgi:hypothetical protein